jgi:eukaryotic-like serine/threonine-protein kinase
MSQATPKRIGGFELIAPLGEGGFGRVYEARSESGDVVALKVAKGSLLGRNAGRLLTSQENEIEALLRLRHPGVVRVLSYGMDEQAGLYLAMEYARGEPLNEFMRRRGRLDAYEAIPLVIKVVEAVAYCHALDVLHLDLKPENIVVVDDHAPRIKILDFGLAQMRRAWKSSEDSTWGTPSYMPPEALAGNALPTVQHDLYAIGTILYELVSGALPFDFSSLSRGLAEKTRNEPQSLRRDAPLAPEPLTSFVERLIARDPERRPRTAVEVRDELNRLHFAALTDVDRLEGARGAGANLLVGLEEAELVGRDRELARLSSAFERASEGEGAFIAVMGEAGLGKSRLASELLAQLEVAVSSFVAYGRCRELGQLVPYAVVREAIGELMRTVLALRGKRAQAIRGAIVDSLGDDSSLVCGLVPEITSLYERPPNDDPSVSRLMRVEHIAPALRSLLATIGAAVPVILVLEDLHWADEATRELVRQMLSPQPPARVLALFTSRPGWVPFDGVEVIALEPLGHDEAKQQIAALLGGDGSSEIVERLMRAIPLLKAGNPLYNAQVVRSLVHEGLVTQGESGLQIDSSRMDRYAAPESVAVALRRTIETLDAAERRVLGVGAMLGRQFQVDLLQSLKIAAAGEVERVIAVAERLHLCHREGNDCLIVHDLVASELERAVEDGARAKLHRHIADALSASVDAEPGMLAHHLEHAGETLASAGAYLRAAALADELHDPAGAVRHLQRALSLAFSLGAAADRDAVIVEAAHHLSRVGCMLGANDEVLRSLERAEEEVADPSGEAKAILNSALSRVLYTRGDFLPAVQRSQQVLVMVAQDTSLAPHACVPSNILGRALVATGRFGNAADMLTRGCQLAEQNGEHLEVSHSEGVLSVALGFIGRWAEAKQRAQTCAALAERLGDPVRKAGAMFYFAVLGESSFDIDLGVRSTYDLLRFVEEKEIGGLYLQMGTIWGGRHQFHLGRLDRAQVMLRNGLNLARITKIGMGVGWAQAFLGDAYFVAGDLAKAREAYEAAIQIGNQRNDEYAGPPALVGIAQIIARTTRKVDDIVRHGDEALERLEKAHNRTAQVYALQRYAEALDAVSDPRAGDLHERRDALIEDLGVDPESCDWWPAVPERITQTLAVAGLPSGPPSSRQPVSPRFFIWQSIQAAGGVPLAAGSSPGLDGPVGYDETQEVRRSTLVSDIGTVEGYEPPFMAKKTAGG